jgi:translation initiation factor 6
VPVGRGILAGSPYLGVYFRVAEEVALVPPSTPGPLRRELERALAVRVEPVTVSESELLGALLAMNSNGILVGDRIDPVEKRRLESAAPVTEIRVRQNALGNNVLVNDRGALVHPDLSEEAVRAIGQALRVPVVRGTLAGLGTVGMAGSATNRGAVVHPKATGEELEAASAALGVPVHRSTANFGVAVVGACLVANSKGLLTGTLTTPVELVHLQEGFGVYG